MNCKFSLDGTCTLYIAHIQLPHKGHVHAIAHNLKSAANSHSESRKTQTFFQDDNRSEKVSWAPLEYSLGRDTAQAVSGQLPIMAAWVRTRVRSCEIYGEEGGIGAGFLRVLRFPLPIIPLTALHSSSFIIWGWYKGQ
jgi:hypothetical protein